MTTIFSGLLNGQQAGIGKALVGDKPDDAERKGVDLTASIFFDGTGNNRTNTTIRLDNVGATYVVVEGHKVAMKNSYVCYYSNVAVMEYMNKIKDNATEVSYYVEGIGTQDGLDDDNLGSGFGAGPTGIQAKVTKGITELTKRIQVILRDTKGKIGKLTVNVFGFSRGSAAARHFVSRRSPAFFPGLSSLSGALGVTADVISFNFVGLYDTVSSYGGEKHKTLIGQIIHNKLHKSFDDDVDELRLAIGGDAQQVVQFAAADEYRENFASTNIRSSVRARVGLEVLLPGVHCDIGGSYEERKEERRYVLATERDRLINQGWYTADQLTLISPGWYEGRRTLTHHFQFIPLALMMKLTEPFGLTFESFDEADNKDYRVPADLQGLAAKMTDFVLGRPAPTSLQPYAPAVFDLPPEFNPLRNKYLHRSAVKGELSTTGIAMAGRETKHLPDRQYITDAADVH